MPEDVSPALDAFRLPLSAIRDAELIVVLGDDPVVERAPIVDLWLRAARRAGADVVTTPIGDAGPRHRCRPRRRAWLPAARERARDPDLVGPGRPGRSDGRRPRRRARFRREARLRRVPAPRDRERARRRRRLGCRGRRRGGRPRADRAADRLRRRGGGEPGRPRPGRARDEGARDLDVPLPARPAGPTSSSPARATSSATAPT